MNTDPTNLEAAEKGAREIYYQALLLAETLGEKLALLARPVASELTLIVTNPLITNNILPPIELQAYGYTTQAVRLEMTEADHGGYPSADVRIVLELTNDARCHIPLPPGDSEEVTYSFVHPNARPNPVDHLPEILEGNMRRDEVSAIISRLVEPTTDPSFTNFRRLDSVAARQEVVEILENTDYVQIIEVNVYEVDGHEITVSKEAITDEETDPLETLPRQLNAPSGHVTEISVALPKLGEDEMIALRTTLDPNSHSQEFYMYEGNRRRTIPPYPKEMLAFRDTLEFLLEQISAPLPATESYDDLAAKSLARNARKTKEERE